MTVLLREVWPEPTTELMSPMRERVRSVVVALDPATGTERLDDIELVTSELMANGMTYAAPPLVLEVTCEDQHLRIELTDASPDLLPPPPPKAALEETGRGLMIADRLSDRWGWQVGQTSKTVWVEFDRV